jgi:TetR/AcrR family transcriptional repressor of nem operon
MTLSTSTKKPSTADRMLDVAERLVQVRGFNGFSYADVARELEITKASLHYHFPGKAELGEALISRYAARFAEALTEIDHETTGAQAKLDAYVGIYSDVLSEGRMCLCGILAAEYETLPEPMREAVSRFFETNEDWLMSILSQGQADRSLSFNGSPLDAARMILSGLEGAMLIARTHGKADRFHAAANRLLDTLHP